MEENGTRISDVLKTRINLLSNNLNYGSWSFVNEFIKGDLGCTLGGLIT